MKAERGKDEALTLRAMPMTRDCVADIREIIVRARRSVVRHVNTTMTLAYWLIGRRIVVEEQKGNRRATYGEHLLQRISRELTADFGNGFGEPQLRNCRVRRHQCRLHAPSPPNRPATRRDALKSCRMLFYYIAKNNVSVADIPMYGLVL